MTREERFVRLVELVVLFSIVALLASEALLYEAPGNGGIAVTTSIQEAGSTGFINSTLRDHLSAHVSQAYLWGRAPPKNWSIEFYYDNDYPASQAARADWYGLSQHIATVAGFRGYPLTVNLLDAGGLASFLQRAPQPGQLVVLASGVLPATVFSGSSNLLLNWMREGGTALWVGSPIGYYVGYSGQTVSCGNGPSPGWSGTADFLNLSLLGLPAAGTGECPGESSTAFVNASQASSALGIGYPYSLPDDDFLASALSAQGDPVLGNLWNGFSNVAMVAEGRGWLVDFGGPLEDVTSFSVYVVNLVMSGILSGAVQLVGGSTVTLSPGVPSDVDQVVSLPASSSSGNALCVLTTQTDYVAEFGQVDCEA